MKFLWQHIWTKIKTSEDQQLTHFWTNNFTFKEQMFLIRGLYWFIDVKILISGSVNSGLEILPGEFKGYLGEKKVTGCLLRLDNSL